MALEYDRITFNPARQKAVRRDLVWSRLILNFKDTETDHHPSIELTLLQTMRPETTISAIESEATDHAKTILRAALSVLEENDVTSLLDKGGSD
jgi:hypothetical protein